MIHLQSNSLVPRLFAAYVDSYEQGMMIAEAIASSSVATLSRIRRDDRLIADLYFPDDVDVGHAVVFKVHRDVSDVQKTAESIVQCSAVSDMRDQNLVEFDRSDVRLLERVRSWMFTNLPKDDSEGWDLHSHLNSLIRDRINEVVN